jgi:dolichyl-phosphate-mannose-protein mannosyltransferase
MSVRFSVTVALTTSDQSRIASLAGAMDASTYRVWLTAVALTALLLQAGLLWAGFERMSADESGRALMAHGLTWANALEPFIWPPFTKIFVGLALKLHDNVFIVPRILSGAAGLLVLLVLVQLARELFQDQRVQLVTAVLAAVLPYRLLFSVAPMSDIYYVLFLLCAATCVLRWLRQGGAPTLLAGCASLLLAQTVRYEAVVFGFCLGLLVLLRWWRAGGVGTLALVGAGLLLGGFPVFWVMNSLDWYGSLDNLRITSQQFQGALGADYAFALQWLPISRPLLLELIWNPACTVGVVALMSAARQDRKIRAWAFTFGTPLVLISAMMLLTLSIPTAVTWRTFGFWSLLLVPWTAQGLVLLSAPLPPALRRVPLLAVMVTLALVPPLGHDAWLAWRDGMMNWETGHRRMDRQVGLALRAALERQGGRALVDSYSNLDFLDVIAGSGAPDLFVTSAAADPIMVAAYLPTRAKHLRDGDQTILDLYLSDHFALARGGDPAALAQHGIRLLLVRDPGFQRGLDASPLVERVPFNSPDWVLYRLRPAAAPSTGD